MRMHEPVRHSVAGRHRPQADDLDRAIKHFVTLAAEFESKYSSAGGREAIERITAESSNLEEMLLLGLQQPDPMPAVDAAHKRGRRNPVFRRGDFTGAGRGLRSSQEARARVELGRLL